MFDVLIVGGGLVGSSLACALQNHGLHVGLIEAKPWALNPQASLHYDDRVIALAYSSRLIFQDLGLWTQIAPQATPIQRIHVSDRGHWGFTRLSAQDLRLEALGYVIEAKVLGRLLQQHINQAQQLQIFAPAHIKSVQLTDTQASVEIEQVGQQQLLHSRLLVVADGSASAVCQQLNLSIQRHHYAQTAIIANLSPSVAHDNIAYERFTDTGPLALLPMREQRCSLVWTVKPQQADGLQQLNPPDFLKALQQRFGWRLGRFTQIGQRHAYPLSLISVKNPVQQRLVVIGNAAHSLHPVGGQGFNLGLRDVSALAHCLLHAQQQRQDLGKHKVLTHYHRLRQPDQTRTQRITNTLVQLFSNDIPSLTWLRNLGLLGLDQTSWLKQIFAQSLTGLSTPQAPKAHQTAEC